MAGERESDTSGAALLWMYSLARFCDAKTYRIDWGLTALCAAQGVLGVWLGQLNSIYRAMADG